MLYLFAFCILLFYIINKQKNDFFINSVLILSALTLNTINVRTLFPSWQSSLFQSRLYESVNSKRLLYLQHEMAQHLSQIIFGIKWACITSRAKARPTGGRAWVIKLYAQDGYNKQKTFYINKEYNVGKTYLKQWYILS